MSDLTTTCRQTPDAPTHVRVARQAAALALAAADEAMYAACRSTSRNGARLEEAMHAAHDAACQAEQYASWAESWETDEVSPHVLTNYTVNAINAAVRAQSAAGTEVSASELHAALRRPMTEKERAEQINAWRREEAREEASERAATGLDRDNRQQAALNSLLAEDAVPQLGWTAGHLRVLEAAETGCLYWRDGQARQARQHGQWEGGRRLSRDRTRALHAARFLTAIRHSDGTYVCTPSPTGRAAMELARLNPAGLHHTDRAAYEARYTRAARSWMTSDEKKAAGRRLQPLDAIARRLYRTPVTLAEQEARLERDAADQWEDEGGYCPGVQTPRSSAKPAPAAARPAEPPATDGLTCPPGLHVVPLISTRLTDWWGLECGRCVPGVRAPLAGRWDNKGDAYAAARGHYEEAHRPADDALTAAEIQELRRWPLSDAQYDALCWAKDRDLYEDEAGFVAIDVSPDRADVNKKVAHPRATGLWAAGLLDVGPHCPGVRQLYLSKHGWRVLRLLHRARLQGAQRSPKDAKLAPLPRRSRPYPLLSKRRYFQGETAPPAPTNAPTTPQPADAPASTMAPEQLILF
jgi:hypothetical protein